MKNSFRKFYCSCSDSCEGGCGGRCGDRACSGSCSKDCGPCTSCTGSCSGCSGSCKGCTGCSGSCKGSCTSCSGCSSCMGTCQGGCNNTCNNRCNTACTAENQSQNISNIGINIIRNRLVSATDFTQLKTAMDNEYRRRNKAVPSAFEIQPEKGKKVLYKSPEKVLLDVYNFDKKSSHDWRGNIAPEDGASAADLEPVIVYIKQLATQVVL